MLTSSSGPTAQANQRRFAEMAQSDVSESLDAMVGRMNLQTRYRDEHRNADDTAKKKRTDDGSMRLANLLHSFISKGAESQKKLQDLENELSSCINGKTIRDLESKLANKEKEFKECEEERKKHH